MFFATMPGETRRVPFATQYPSIEL